MKKLRIGIFSFTCDEGCSISFLEILNKKFFEWKDFIDFKHFRLLQSKSEIKNLDFAFVEGAISNKGEVKKIKEIRKNAKNLILIGNCAISGSPSNSRNFFDEERKKEIEPIIRKFGHLKKVLSVKDVVKVDGEIPGCPLEEDKFVRFFEKIIEGGKNAPRV